MGRPKKRPAERRESGFFIPMTLTEHRAVTEAAKATGEDRARWARGILLAAAKVGTGTPKEAT